MRREYFIIGAVFLIIGALFLAKGLSKSDGKLTIRGGAVGFIGPIPLFGFGSDKKMLYWLLGIGFLLFLIFWLVRFAGR